MGFDKTSYFCVCVAFRCSGCRHTCALGSVGPTGAAADLRKSSLSGGAAVRQHRQTQPALQLHVRGARQVFYFESKKLKFREAVSWTRLPPLRAFAAENVSTNLYVISQPWLYTLAWCAGAQSVTTNSIHILSTINKPLFLMVSRLKSLYYLKNIFYIISSIKQSVFWCHLITGVNFLVENKNHSYSGDYVRLWMFQNKHFNLHVRRFLTLPWLGVGGWLVLDQALKAFNRWCGRLKIIPLAYITVCLHS